MRVRITKPPIGMIDGVQVSVLRIGTVCELSAALATCLIVEGWAEPVHPSEATEARRGVSVLGPRRIAEVVDI